MSDNSSSSPDDAWAQEQENSILRTQERRRTERKMMAITGVVILLIIAIAPMLFGIGLFGLHSCQAERVQVWVYNTTDSPVGVRISVPAPLGSVSEAQIEAQGIQRIFFSSGTRNLEVTNAQGERREEVLELKSHTVITTGENTCYAVFDVTSFYHEQITEQAEMSLVERVPAGTFIYSTTATTLVVPRQAMPRRAAGAVHWLEDFDCSLLEPENEAELMLVAYAKLETREEAFQERLEQRRAR